MTWLTNIKDFFVNNSTAILAFLTPANIAAMITAIVMVIKNKRSVKDNTAATKELANSTDKLETVSVAMTTNSDTLEYYRKDIAELSAVCTNLRLKFDTLVTDVGDKFDLIDNKLCAILDVQSLVYNTIQNDDLRVNVQNAIATAKLATDNTRSKLQTHIEELKQQISDVTEHVAEVVSAKTDAINKVVSTKKANAVARY